MSCGLVPIVSNTRGNLAVVKDGKNGKVVRLKNMKEDLISSIKLLNSDFGTYQTLSTSTLETTQRYYDGPGLRNQIIELLLGKK